MKKKKIAYKVRNWKEYNRALVKRGDLTVWFDKKALEKWYPGAATGRGRPPFYADACIETLLTFGCLFGLPLRATQGFADGLLSLLGLEDNPVPHYSTLCRRAAGLPVGISRKAKTEGATDIAVDSTGLKIYGEGEWKMRTHGKSKRRTWRKLHIAMDPGDGQIIAMELTEAGVHDDTMMEPLLEGLEGVGTVYADGAYVSGRCFNAITDTGAKASIPLRKDVGIVGGRGDPGLEERDRLIGEIEEAGGKEAWKKSSGHHRRSLSENTMYRFKTLFGGRLSRRKLSTQKTEARLKVSILNGMAALGMPDSYPVAAV